MFRIFLENASFKKICWKTHWLIELISRKKYADENYFHNLWTRRQLLHLKTKECLRCVFKTSRNSDILAKKGTFCRKRKMRLKNELRLLSFPDFTKYQICNRKSFFFFRFSIIWDYFYLFGKLCICFKELQWPCA